MNHAIDEKNKPTPNFIDGFATGKKIPDSYRILIPLYVTHLIFILSLFFVFIPKGFITIGVGLLIFIILVSIYITRLVFRIERQNRRVETEKKLDELRLEKLLELSSMAEESINALAEFALEEACKLTQSEFGCLEFLNDDQDDLTTHLWPKQSVDQGQTSDDGLTCNVKDNGLWADVEKSGSILVINDCENHNPIFKQKFSRGNVRIFRVMSAPAFEDDKMVALISVGNKKENYHDSDIRQLQLMMDGMWKILQEKKAEIELKKSEEKYRLLADNATDTIWIIQYPDLKLRYVSPSIESLLGYTPAEFLGLEMKEYMTEYSLKQVPVITSEFDDEFDGHPESKAVKTVELALIKKDATTIWVEISAGFFRNNKDEPDGILCISRDISDRKRADEILQRTMELMSGAGRIAKVGGWSIDIKSQAIIWSDGMNAIHELQTPSPQTFDEVIRFIAPEWRGKILNAYDRCVGEDQRLDEKFEIITAKGCRRWVHATGEVVRDDTGEMTCVIGALQDISDRIQADEERKNLQQHLDQARKMEAIGVLAGGIAHDFNNILSGVMGFTDLAMHEAKDNEALKRYLKQVSLSSLRARDLVRHILTFSRKSDVEKQSINIYPIIKESLKFMRASLPASIEIQHDLRLEQGQVFGDATQIYQVLIGLFTNAGYAMKDYGGVLEIVLDRVKLDDTRTGFLGKISAGEFIELVISDTGCGIHEKYLDRIFEPFFTTKGREEGTGMGLATVYGIIKEMGGGISVYSEIGVGTTFRILLPEHDQVEPSEMQVNTGLKKGQGNILVVDDEKVIAESACDILTILGYSAVVETDSLNAIENVKKTPAHYDLILTDMTMPHLDGFELAKQIKKINPDIAIVLATGFSHGLTKEKCRDAGITNMVMKPMTAGELSLIIEKAMKKKEG